MIAGVPSRPLLLALMIASGAATGCAGATAEGTGSQEPPVVLELTDVSGRHFGVQDFRGKPLLLFVFATYDSASQIAMLTLERFATQNRDVAVIGVAAQPQAARLLPLHRDTLNIRIPLAYDEHEVLISGHSALGPVEVIPNYVLLDAAGRIRARHAGPLDQPRLEQLVASVR
ncbi:MAG TPA: TlpA disulfide reductase family protein [Polyangiales bacterium]|nr:TlpA disulfide reductase family protein [Polyangiales bacterium]